MWNLPDTLFVNPEAGNPVVKGDPAKRCCKASIFTPFVLDKPFNAAKDAAALLAFEEAPPFKPAPILMQKMCW